MNKIIESIREYLRSVTEDSHKLATEIKLAEGALAKLNESLAVKNREIKALTDVLNTLETLTKGK